jgi:hypothetical protein
MKKLNADEQYARVIDLFEQHKQANINQLSSSIIVQALKACTQMGDLQRGQEIHRLASSRVKTDGYILSSLIHFYSELLFFDVEACFFSLLFDRSALWGCENRRFSVQSLQAERLSDLWSNDEG